MRFVRASWPVCFDFLTLFTLVFTKNYKVIGIEVLFFSFVLCIAATNKKK